MAASWTTSTLAQAQCFALQSGAALVVER